MIAETSLLTAELNNSRTVCSECTLNHIWACIQPRTCLKEVDFGTVQRKFFCLLVVIDRGYLPSAQISQISAWPSSPPQGLLFKHWK